MTKNISDELKSHLSNEVTTLANCWVLKRTDGVIKTYTDLDKDLIYDNQVYISIAGFSTSSVESKADLSVDNLDVEGVMYNGHITSEDLMAGLYDFAEIEVFVVNYEDTSQGKLLLKRGIIGEVKLQKDMFTAEMRGITEFLQKQIGEVYSPSCRATFCDGRCKLDPNNFTHNGSITYLTSQMILTTDLSQDSGYFTNGVIEWLTGANTGLKQEIKEYTNKQLVLALAMPNTIRIGDTFKIRAGCDKKIQACIDRFNNAINFRGEPYLPGLDAISKTSGTMKR